MIQKNKIKILYLDDDIENLSSFKANFRKDFDIHTVSNPRDALAFLDDNLVHIVLSDQRMPDFSGVEFFELLLLKYPDPVRILVTGYADIDAIIAAINNGDVFKYIKKPWDRKEILIEIQNAYEYYKAKLDGKITLRKLNNKKQELEKFIYSASHDLRAPLVSILGLLKIMKEEENTERRESYFNMIEESVKDMDYYIQNMINFYQNQTAPVTRDRIDFTVLCNNLLQNVEQINSQKQVVIDLQVNQEFAFFSDEKRILSVLSNLMSNAIMYSDDKKDIKTAKLKIDVTKDEVLISIVDNGIGMQNTKKLFDLFIENSKKRGFGAGLGLYVSKEAVTKVKGSINIESILEVGTTVKIKIPNDNE